MQAVAVSAPGSDYALTLEAVACPLPAKHEVRIRVAYAGVNRADLVQAEGRYPVPEGANPRLGLEVSGTIDAMGDDVIGWSLGEEVCSLVEGGGYAEYVCVPASYLLSIPNRMSLKDAAAIPEAIAAGWMALVDKGGLKRGETVLIQGAAGGIGPMMVQLARALGANVIVTASSDEKCAMLEHLGAKAVNYARQTIPDAVTSITGGKGVDIIIDPLGAGSAAMHLAMLNTGGRLVTIGFLQGNVLEQLSIGRMLMKSLSWSAFSLRSQSYETKIQLMQALRTHVLPLIAKGQLVPHIDTLFPLAEAQKAHARMKERLHCGKILLEMQHSK